MRERPISFKPDLVRAFLRREKTQTRRVITPVRRFEYHNVLKMGMPHSAYPWAVWWHGPETDRVGCLQECPYGKPGDRLWVRESSCLFDQKVYTKTGVTTTPMCIYRADGHKLVNGAKWRPPMFMPRRVCRLVLEISEVRAQWLQDITEEDAIAEGVKPWAFGPEQTLTTGERGADSPYRSGFAVRWDEINEARGSDGEYLWIRNPGVWVLTLKEVWRSDSVGHTSE